MPELPEVETIVRELSQSNLIGLSIEGADILWHRTLATPSIKAFKETILHQKIRKIERKGKFIVISLSKDTLLIHLRMTGKLILSDSRVLLPHERAQLKLSDGRYLHFDDQRKFGKWYFLHDPEEKLQELGIEPLSERFTLKAFKELLPRSKQPIKAFLLNQSFIAGLGNIYVDEALWMAKIHPATPTNSLTDSQARELHTAIPKVLEQGIASQGTSLGKNKANYVTTTGKRGSNQNHLNVFRRNGKPCPRCQTTIIKITLAQRGTHLCPHCQQKLSY